MSYIPEQYLQTVKKFYLNIVGKNVQMKIGGSVRRVIDIIIIPIEAEISDIPVNPVDNYSREVENDLN